MSAEPTSPPAAPDEPKRPFYKDPFVIAFAIGVVLLTVYRVSESRLYRAPPPIRDLPAWSLSTFDGGTLASTTLSGKVLLVEFVPAPCDEACIERVDAFGRELDHTVDLGDAVRLVSVVMPGAVLVDSHVKGPFWHAVTGDEAQLRSLLVPLREGWATFAGTDAGSTLDDFFHFPGIALIDDHQALRAFWKDTGEGRGNAVNAARMLVKHPEASPVR
jgi:cytochrome oxidase Cu insertion factor (SCO1/SenC/PrrC family)